MSFLSLDGQFKSVFLSQVLGHGSVCSVSNDPFLVPATLGGTVATSETHRPSRPRGDATWTRPAGTTVDVLSPVPAGWQTGVAHTGTAALTPPAQGQKSEILPSPHGVDSVGTRAWGSPRKRADDLAATQGRTRGRPGNHRCECRCQKVEESPRA